jgi:hypothetical protein
LELKIIPAYFACFIALGNRQWLGFIHRANYPIGRKNHLAEEKIEFLCLISCKEFTAARLDAAYGKLEKPYVKKNKFLVDTF